MKLKQLVPIVFIVLFSFQFLFSQSNSEISKAIAAGSAKELAKHFNENIDLKIPGTDGVFNKMQAELILKDFFIQNPIESYEVKHEGKSKNEAHYSIGELILSSNRYRTYILIKKQENAYRIIEFNIELDE